MFKVFGDWHTQLLQLPFLCSTPVARAQVSVGVNIGPAPVCPYGYFDYAPYDCAPYGYYGPRLDPFIGGVFLGAGPWFHGPRRFFWDTSTTGMIPSSRLRWTVAGSRGGALQPLPGEMRRGMGWQRQRRQCWARTEG